MPTTRRVGIITPDHPQKSACARVHLPGHPVVPTGLRVGSVGCGYAELSTEARPFRSDLNIVRPDRRGRFALQPEGYREKFEPGRGQRLVVATRWTEQRCDVLIFPVQYIGPGAFSARHLIAFVTPGWAGLPSEFWRDL